MAKHRFSETSLGAYDAAHPPPDSDLRLTLDAALARLIGLGVAAARGLLLGLRWLWRRRTGLV